MLFNSLCFVFFFCLCVCVCVFHAQQQINNFVEGSPVIKRQTSYKIKYLWKWQGLYWFITQTCLTMGGNDGFLMPCDSLLTAKTYLWVSSLGEKMINKYLSELMFELKGILNHTPLLTRLISTRCWYGTTHSFCKEEFFQNVLEITTLI